MRFEFATAARIIFGAGCLKEVPPLLKGLGRNALAVTGREAKRAEPLLAMLQEQGIGTVVYSVNGEPELETVERGMGHAKESGCDMVISFGGGSAIDTGKAIAAMMTNDGQLLDYLEHFNRSNRNA